MVTAALGITAGTSSIPTGTASAVASLQLGITATSSPSYWLQDRTFEVVLANDGTEPVSDVSGLVSSPVLPGVTVALDAPTPVVGNGDEVLEPGEQWRYDVTVPTISSWGFLTAGTLPDGSTVEVFERSERVRYPGALTFPASIAMDYSSGPFPAGTEVPFVVTATNEVDIPLTIDCEQALDDAVLTKELQPIGPPAAAGDGDGVLDPGEVWTWSFTHPVTASGETLHVRCDVDRAGAPTGGLGVYEIGPLIALPPPPGALEIVATPTSKPTMWLEDRTYDLLVTNTGEARLWDVAVGAASDDATPAGGASITDPIGVGDADTFRFDPGEQLRYTATVPNLGSWTFTASASTTGGDDVTDRVAGERGAPDGTYAHPSRVAVAPAAGELIVIGEPAEVSVANLADFALTVTVDAPWGRDGATTTFVLAPDATSSWTLLAPPETRLSYAYERDVVGFALGASVDLSLVYVDPPPPTTAPSGRRLPTTGAPIEVLVTLAAGVGLLGAMLLAMTRRDGRRTHP